MRREKLEKTLIEFKAKLKNKDKSKAKLLNVCRADYIGEYQQLDTHFKVPKGHLKLRQLAGVNSSHLIYYEREMLKGPKESKAWIAKIIDPEALRILLQKFLPITAVVNKHREIYICDDIQIHLDEVEGLGSYIEFEVEVQNKLQTKKLAQDSLSEFMKILNINDQDLEEASYSDLLSNLT